MTIYGMLFFWRRKSGIPKMSTERLWASIKSNNPKDDFLTRLVVEELLKRDEDITPAIPRFAKLMTRDSFGLRIIGEGLMLEHFPELLQDIEYKAIKKPNPETRIYLESLADESDS